MQPPTNDACCTSWYLAPERAQYVRKFMGFVRPENPALEATASKADLISAVKQLCNADSVELMQDMSMIKPPGGREKPWHQDSAYFNYDQQVPVVCTQCRTRAYFNLGRQVPVVCTGTTRRSFLLSFLPSTQSKKKTLRLRCRVLVSE